MLKDKEMEYVKGNPEINPLSRFLIENQISYDEVEKILKNAGLENSSYKT